MIRTALAATALLAATPALSQSTTQDEIDARYERALAAGYKALFLCGALSSSETFGVPRSVDSVEEWELTGIQAPLDAIVPELKYEIFRTRGGAGVLSRVEVKWADDMPNRIAWHREEGGCSLSEIGEASPSRPETLPMFPEQGMVLYHSRINPPALQRVFGGAMLTNYGEGTRTTAISMSVNGRQYWQYREPFTAYTPQRTWSVAKSIAVTLVGAAVYRGEADVNASAGLGLDADDPRRSITIDHLLRMASGRYSDTPGNRTDPLYFGGGSVSETAMYWPLVHPPGSVYRYANNDTLAAVATIKDTFEFHPPRAFFNRVGMSSTIAETDLAGDYILSSQVWATAPDLLKLGQLYLNDGVLPDGTRILPEGWVEYVSAPSGPQPDGPFGYGAGFWLFNKSEGIPPDTFAAMGNRGQFIVIVPSLNVVIVRRGEDPAGSRFDIAGFTRDVLESLAE